MDKDASKESDKRNWRERLGIGTAPAAAGGRDLPRIAEEFQPKPTAAARPPVAKASVKPAPMAPRTAPRASAQAPVSPDKLAEKLRMQRDAQAKLAEQRVQAARGRVDQPIQADAPVATSPISTPVASSTGSRPKFTFAEEDREQTRMGTPAAPASASPPLTPPRPPLGAGASATPPYQPRATVPPAMPQSAQMPPRPAQNYGQPPMPGYRPQQDFGAGYGQQPWPAPGSMRPASNGFNVPQRPAYSSRPALNPNYGPVGQDSYPPPQGFGPDPRLSQPRMDRAPAPPRMPMPQAQNEMEEDELFQDAPPPRMARRSAADYQQAYRDMEQGYEEEEPRSRGPWILLALLLLALAVAGAGVWFYQTSIRPSMTAGSSNTQQVPEVAAPAGETTTQPEQTAPAPAASSNKKAIYDRIVGDQEVLGGQVAPSEEVPLAPADGASQLPADQGQPLQGEGSSDGTAPLPIPPPPGDGNTQGSLQAPQDPAAAQLENSAAGDNQAAVLSQEQVPAPSPSPPAPGETVEPSSASAESIVDEPKPVEQQAVAKPVKKTSPKKKPDQSANLGSKPVVLVPPKKVAAAAPAEQPADPGLTTADTVSTDSDGIYGATVGEAPSSQPQPQPTTKKKKKTLADLFNGSEDTQAQFVEPEPAPKPTTTAQVAPKPAVPAKPVVSQPAEPQVASTSGYVAQLASFRSKQEAVAEYGRLKSKHSTILQGYPPVITQAEVAGSTRYRLAVGGLTSKEQASAMCSKLIGAGERDCLVKRQ